MSASIVFSRENKMLNGPRTSLGRALLHWHGSASEEVRRFRMKIAPALAVGVAIVTIVTIVTIVMIAIVAGAILRDPETDLGVTMTVQRHTIVFSDFHLPPAAEGDGVWMRYRSPRFFIDEDFSRLADRLLDELGDDPFEVAFNGDVFELDGADGYRGTDQRRDVDLGDEDSETASLATILDDHAVLVAAVGRLLARARRVVFLAGNHDLGLYWPRVRALLTARLVAAAREAGAHEDAGRLAARVVFRQWFHRTPDGIFIEHGHQYDAASSSPDPLVPRRGDGDGLWLSMGSIGFRHVLGHVGTMNPHANGSFLLGLGGYVRHYYRYYFRKGRAILRRAARGGLRVLRHMWRQRRPSAGPPPGEAEEALRELEDQANDLPPGTLGRLRTLHERPATADTYRYLRDLRLDWVLLGAVLALLSLASALVIPWPWDLVSTLLVAGVFLGYERLAPPVDYVAYEDGLPEVAAAVARLTGVEVIVTGHTHLPGTWPLEGGGVLVNTGTWAPGFHDAECRRPTNGAKAFAWIRSTPQARQPALDVRLLAWDRGRIVACAAPGDGPPSPPALENDALDRVA